MEPYRPTKSSYKTVGLAAFAVVGTIAACLLVASSQSVQQQLIATDNNAGLFAQWQAQYGVSYATPEEEAYRLEVFNSNIDIINEFNTQKGNTYTIGLTKFADLTKEEFSAQYLGYTPRPNRVRNVKILDTTDVPTSVNWTAAGATTPVKNQAQCGSCWSFSTTGSLEGLHYISNGTLLSFSEQQLMDCSWLYGNKGCDGGEMDLAFDYVQAKGIELESTYPYTAKSSIFCKYSKTDVVFNIGGHTDVQHNSIEQLQAAVAQQPVSIAVEADQSSWQLYTGGIINSNCGQALDHGVLAAGYGTDSTTGTNYWWVKNSWGTSWGLEGYLMIESSTADYCGVLLDPSYPTV